METRRSINSELRTQIISRKSLISILLQDKTKEATTKTEYRIYNPQEKLIKVTKSEKLAVNELAYIDFNELCVTPIVYMENVSLFNDAAKIQVVDDFLQAIQELRNELEILTAKSPHSFADFADLFFKDERQILQKAMNSIEHIIDRAERIKILPEQILFCQELKIVLEAFQLRMCLEAKAREITDLVNDNSSEMLAEISHPFQNKQNIPIKIKLALDLVAGLTTQEFLPVTLLILKDLHASTKDESSKTALKYYIDVINRENEMQYSLAEQTEYLTAHKDHIIDGLKKMVEMAGLLNCAELQDRYKLLALLFEGIYFHTYRNEGFKSAVKNAFMKKITGLDLTILSIKKYFYDTANVIKTRLYQQNLPQNDNNNSPSVEEVAVVATNSHAQNVQSQGPVLVVEGENSTTLSIMILDDQKEMAAAMYAAIFNQLEDGDWMQTSCYVGHKIVAIEISNKHKDKMQTIMQTIQDILAQPEKHKSHVTKQSSKSKVTSSVAKNELDEDSFALLIEDEETIRQREAENEREFWKILQVREEDKDKRIAILASTLQKYGLSAHQKANLGFIKVATEREMAGYKGNTIANRYLSWSPSILKDTINYLTPRINAEIADRISKTLAKTNDPYDFLIFLYSTQLILIAKGSYELLDRVNNLIDQVGSTLAKLAPLEETHIKSKTHKIELKKSHKDKSESDKKTKKKHHKAKLDQKPLFAPIPESIGTLSETQKEVPQLSVPTAQPQ